MFGVDVPEDVPPAADAEAGRELGVAVRGSKKELAP